MADKLKKATLALLIVLLAFISTCAGVSVGRRSVGESAMITYDLVPEATDPLPDTVININTATAEELMTLPGVGEVLANRIIAYRTANGPFNRVDELILVEGIGLGTLDRFREQITVGG